MKPFALRVGRIALGVSNPKRIEAEQRASVTSPGLSKAVCRTEARKGIFYVGSLKLSRYPMPVIADIPDSQ